MPVPIKRAVNLAKGSGEPHKTKVGKITEKQVEEIAKISKIVPVHDESPTETAGMTGVAYVEGPS